MRMPRWLRLGECLVQRLHFENAHSHILAVNIAGHREKQRRPGSSRSRLLGQHFRKQHRFELARIRSESERIAILLPVLRPLDVAYRAKYRADPRMRCTIAHCPLKRRAILNDARSSSAAN